tara:strand:+ start:2337 stop:3101 length:765 start_codon:yes stop_codon:yes gene_type:complete
MKKFTQNKISDFFSGSDSSNSETNLQKNTKSQQNLNSFFKTSGKIINKTKKIEKLEENIEKNTQDNSQKNIQSNSEKNELDFFSKKEKIVVFTDGSTINNGKKNAIGGMGIYFPDNNYPNLSEKYQGDIPTNQKCELIAILKSLQIIAKKTPNTNDFNITVFTDSEYSISCFTKYINNWINNGWKLVSGKPVKNRKLIENIHNFSKKFNFVQYIHVKAHKDPPIDKNSYQYKLWFGNDMADKLAVKGRNKKITV